MLAADVDPGGLLVITASEKADKIIISAGAQPGTVILRGVPGVAKNAVRSGVKAIIINAGGGNDDCRGDAGDDGVFGDAGRDVLRGGDDDDSLGGGLDSDKLYGDRGDDALDGDEGRDTIYGGLGNDDDYDDDRLEDEDEEDDDDGDGDGDDACDDDDGDDSPLAGGSVTFVGNAAQVSGTSSSKKDKQFYVFVAPATGVLTVSLQPGDGGRYADLEIEDALTSMDLLELEPSEGGTTSGIANVIAGRQYKMRLRSPDLAPVSYTVDLAIAPGA